MKTFYSILILLALVFLTPDVALSQVYDSQNISLHSNWFDPSVPPESFYGIKYNGIWGWHDGNGKEYAIIGATSGVYFVEVTDPANPVVRDFVAGRRDSCIWREIKTYDHYAYLISDDGSPNSFQIVDLNYLPDSVHIVHDDDIIFERAHTLWVDNDRLYVAIPKGGLFTGQDAKMAVFSLANPESPVLLRKLSEDYSFLSNSVHDMYVRNDTIYASMEWSGLYIFTLLSNNTFSLQGSLTTYPQQGYNHSSALSDDGNILIFTDEVPDGLDVKILDVSDITNPTVITTFHTHTDATPHNPFILGDQVFIAYYQDGLQVYDFSTPSAPLRTGYFDTYWQNPAGTYPWPPYAGAWGAYPWLPSGNILVADMQNGLFVLDASAIMSVDNISAPESEIKLWPVPATGKELNVFFNNNYNGKINYFIYDLSGRVIMCGVFDKKSTIQKFDIDVNKLSSGSYVIELSRNEFVQAKKFVK